MKTSFRFYIIMTAILPGMILNSCIKDGRIPVVETQDVTDITYTTATAGGNVTDDRGLTVNSRGICWNISGNPTTTDSISSGGMGPGPFRKNIKNLNPGTTYYLRAYATNRDGTAYGSEVIFKTTKIELPVLKTYVPMFTSQTTIFTGGAVTAFNGGHIITRGICWGTTPNPTTASMTKISENLLNDNFYLTIEGLTVGSTYYLRAYATTEAGTGYGNELKFTIHSGDGPVTDIDENIYNTITIGNQVWMAENLRTTRYNNGTYLNMAINDYWEPFFPVYCWYDNDEAGFKMLYGALYNFYAANNHGDENACPIGWHVPDEEEWTTLINFLGGEGVAGGKLKEAGTTHWIGPNSEATNETGFSALPGGTTNFNWVFSSLGTNGYWWSSSPVYYNRDYHWITHSLSATDGKLVSTEANLHNGYSVRCIRDY